MKRFNQSGMSMKPVAIMLVLLAGLTFYILNDIKKIQTIPTNNKTKTNQTPVGASAEKEPVSVETKSNVHNEVLLQLTEELKKPGVCSTAFISREGKAAKFLNTEEIPSAEDVVKIMLKNEVVLEIDKEIGGYKVQDIYLTSESTTPIKNLGNSRVMAANLQVVWLEPNKTEAIQAKPIPLELVVENTTQVILDCYRGEVVDAAPVVQPQPISTPAVAPTVVATPQVQNVIVETPTGSVCGVVNYECSGSFSGDTPYIESHPALQTDGTFCADHVMGQPKCVFVDAFRGFRLDGLSCPAGYRPLTHAGQLSDVQTGSGASMLTKALQVLMVVCVKQ